MIECAFSRRRFLAGASAATAGYFFARGIRSSASEGLREGIDGPSIAITLDLEMSRNFPTWELTHWDYEKGNLNTETKKYTLEACRRVKAHGGVIHCFAVGRVLEQENVAWLKEIIQGGHPVGNHTYDHVNVTARKPEDIQFRFRRAPWLLQNKSPPEVIAENIRMTNAALKSRLGIAAAGFRTPGGFPNGLADRLDLQRLLLDLGFSWVSSKYPAHPMSRQGAGLTPEVLEGILKAQEQSQPFAYPTGLVEVPMSPISDIGAFRGGRWQLPSFLKAIRVAVEWAIEHRAVFDFLGHPSCLYVTDPEFRTIELICDLVGKAGPHARLVDLGTIAHRVTVRQDG
jgi:peptidoglycan/xylan/chitin deacetylase (PgdA/CDA1 family)